MTAAPRIAGIDPGKTGAIAIISGPHVGVHDMPTVNGELNIEEILRIIRDAKPDMAVIERAASRPGQGVRSVFTFGCVFGALRAVVTCCEVPQHLVAPSAWKKHFKLGPDKEAARGLALRLWPGLGFFNRKKDHNRSEAALIARYGVEVLWRNP